MLGYKPTTSMVTTAADGGSGPFGRRSSRSCVSRRDPGIRDKSVEVSSVMYLSRRWTIFVKVATIGRPLYVLLCLLIGLCVLGRK